MGNSACVQGLDEVLHLHELCTASWRAPAKCFLYQESWLIICPRATFWFQIGANTMLLVIFFSLILNGYLSFHSAYPPLFHLQWCLSALILHCRARAKSCSFFYFSSKTLRTIQTKDNAPSVPILLPFQVPLQPCFWAAAGTPPTLMVAEKPYTSLHWLQIKQAAAGERNGTHPDTV